MSNDAIQQLRDDAAKAALDSLTDQIAQLRRYQK